MRTFDKISQDDLIDRVLTSLRERTPQPAFTLLLGSGFSAPLIPTAGQVVARDVAWWLHWRKSKSKKGIFAYRPANDRAVRDFEKELWQRVHEQVGKSFRLKDGIPEADAENVGTAYQAIMSGQARSGLVDLQSRRRYLRDLSARVGDKVNGAHIFLASILRAQDRWPRPFCRTLFTTNFDPLLQRSLQLVSRLYVMNDRPEALEPPEDEDDDAIHLVYSHGSVYRYLLLNTQPEIEKAGKRNAFKLVPYLEHHGVLVVGYSGWQDATMKALARCKTFSGNLYWCDIHKPEEAEERLSPSARALLIKQRGYAFYVSITSADELMLALHQKLGLKAAPGFIRDPIAQMIEDLESVHVTDARKPSSEPRALDTFKDSRDQTVIRLRAARRVFENPELLRPAGPGEIPAGDRRVYEEAVTAKIMDEALTKWRAGTLIQAIRLWTQVIENKRSEAAFRAKALINRGVALGRRDRLEEEIADYTTVIDMPNVTADVRARALVYRGITNGQNDRWEEEIADYTAVIDMRDAPAEQRATALVYRGITYGQKDRWKEGIADYTAVIDMRDAPAEHRAMALVNRGITYGQKDRWEEEIADYTAVIDMRDAPAEQRAMALINRGIVHLAHGQPKQAITDSTSAIDMPDIPAELKSLAFVNRSWGRYSTRPSDHAGLREDSEAALAIAPQLTGARFNLGLALLLAGKSRRAFREYSRAAKEVAEVDEIRTSREDLERAIAAKRVPGDETILGLLRAREAVLAAELET